MFENPDMGHPVGSFFFLDRWAARQSDTGSFCLNRLSNLVSIML
jgi:hypothetical protein